MYAKLKTITTLAVLGIIVPFLGLPFPWKLWLSSLLALVIAVIAYSVLSRSDKVSEAKLSKDEDPLFIEKHPDQSAVEKDKHEA